MYQSRIWGGLDGLAVHVTLIRSPVLYDSSSPSIVRPSLGKTFKNSGIEGKWERKKWIQNQIKFIYEYICDDLSRGYSHSTVRGMNENSDIEMDNDFFLDTFSIFIHFFMKNQ